MQIIAMETVINCMSALLSEQCVFDVEKDIKDE